MCMARLHGILTRIRGASSKLRKDAHCHEVYKLTKTLGMGGAVCFEPPAHPCRVRGMLLKLEAVIWGLQGALSHMGRNCSRRMSHAS